MNEAGAGAGSTEAQGKAARRGLAPKPLALISAAALAALVLLCWTSPWFTLRLAGVESGGVSGGELIVASGEHAAPALSALALAGLALVAALALAGPVFRLVLAVLEALLGLSVILSAAGALGDPIAAVAALITQTTGIDGSVSVHAAVAEVTTSAWPAVSLVAGALMVALGILIVATRRRWPASVRKYQAVRLADADAPRSAVADWDSLSDGEDPTGTPDAR